MTQRGAPRDRGAVDVSIEMLFGLLAVLAAVLLLFEAAAYWHARNVFADAAADGARLAAAYDGSCEAGVVAARSAVERQAGAWADEVVVTCTDGPLITVTVVGATPGVLAGVLALRASVDQSTPRER